MSVRDEIYLLIGEKLDDATVKIEELIDDVKSGMPRKEIVYALKKIGDMLL